jgi:GT2 family glycosyltransferase
MKANTGVVAAIPNYNMGSHLVELLPSILAQGYDAVYVLDDASTDDSIDIVRSFGSDVILVRGSVNRGAAANRNQILDHVRGHDIIHFIDADMDLVTPDAPLVAREVMARYAGEHVGAVGGLILRPDGSREAFNYGPAHSLKSQLTYALPVIVDRCRHRPAVANALQRIGGVTALGFPDVFASPRPRRTYWLHEGNLLIYADTFHRVGGYDPLMRHHEALDLALKLEHAGVRRHFDPAIALIHHSIDVRGPSRARQKRTARRYLARKHGRWHLLTGGRGPRPSPPQPAQ